MTRGPISLTIALPAEVIHLRFLHNLVRRCLVDAAGLFPSSIEYQQIQIAIREACSNVVEHAYRGRVPGMLQLTLGIEGNGVSVRIEDQGSPVPSDQIRRASMTTPDPTLLMEGGYGLRLIKDTMDQVDYKTLGDGTNILELYKRLNRVA